MFEGKKQIVFIDKNKITLFDVTLGAVPINQVLAEYEWDGQNPEEPLKKIKETGNANLRILLDESFAYVVNVSIPENTKNERAEIQIKAQELIPEDLEKTPWDFKEVLLIKKNPQDTGEKLIQVFVIPKNFFNRLSQIIQSTRLTIEAIEPVSYALARLVKDEELVIVIYGKTSYLMCLVMRGLVVATKEVAAITVEGIQLFVSYAQEHYGFLPKKIIAAHNQETFDYAPFQAEFRIEYKDLNPVIGLALKKDIKGKDEEILEEKKDKPFPIMLLLAVFLLGVGVIIVFFFRTLSNSGKKTESKISPTMGLELSPTVSKPDIGSYTVQILNGSGIEGEASKLQSELHQKGFTIEKTGNADNYDYEDTIVKTKKSVDEKTISLLNKELKTNHIVGKSELLEDYTDVDIIIIIGKNKP